jgi:hypothetical protein
MKVQETLHLQVLFLQPIPYAQVEVTVKWHPRNMVILYTM